MRLGSMADVANPSGRPDMGGSGSPNTTLGAAAGGGVTRLGADKPAATEAGIILPDLCPSAIGKSDGPAPAAGAGGMDFGPFTGGVAGGIPATLAGPEAGGWRPGAALAGNAGG
jgi:hypothetical protein